MEIMMLIFGAVLLLIGLVFIIPYKVVSRLKGKTEGTMQDMTDDAAAFNNEMLEALQQPTLQKDVGPVTLSAHVGRRSNFSNNAPNAVTYHAIYSYCVDGTEYARADSVGYNKGQIQKKLGKKIPVYYDPEAPFKASLSSGRVYKYLIIGLSALGIVLCGVYFLLFLL